jgi:dynein heavy chain
VCVGVHQGLLMIRPQQCAKPDGMMRLWVHEACRVFHDRLIDTADKTYFLNMTIELLTRNFSGSFTYEEMFEEREIIFGDFTKMGLDREDRRYEEVRLAWVGVMRSHRGWVIGKRVSISRV